MKLICVLLFFLWPLIIPTRALAIYDPLSVANNKYGIHIADTNDIPAVSELVNSSGGAWGYVTLVVQDTDRNVDKWQKIFNQLRRAHLIPLVRLATHPEGPIWSVPKKDSFNEWVDFLSQLNWPIENYYIILFNEPNHAKEWGGTVNPEEYASLALELASRLKAKSEHFYLLPAGLDGSATNGSETMDEALFLQRMYASQPGFFDALDGWTSHSYPNPNFSGSPAATGKGTIRQFVWEQEYLKNLGISKDYEVFITETGWIHSEGKTFNGGLLTPQAVGQKLIEAGHGAWDNPHIVAITPFLFSYQDVPFDHFSMKKLGSTEFYEHYFSYQSIPKTKGKPNQLDRLIPASQLLPQTLVGSSTYSLTGIVLNDGESIIDSTDEFTLALEDASKLFTFTAPKLPAIEPGNKGDMQFRLTTPASPGTYRVTLALVHNGRQSIIESHTIHVIPPPSLTLTIRLGFRPKTTVEDVKILVYSDKVLLAKFDHREAIEGVVSVGKLTGIIPGNQYRVVALIPYYLPRQKLVPLSKENTVVVMPRFLPLDFNRDGAFTFKDLSALLKIPPHQVFSLFFGL